MPIAIRGRKDKALLQLSKALGCYQEAHAHAAIDLFREYPAIVLVRVVDPDFAGMSRGDRLDTIWNLFEPLPEEVQTQVGFVLLLTPKEKNKSFANMEFEDKIRRRRTKTKTE